jgi:hypothetical protein
MGYRQIAYLSNNRAVLGSASLRPRSYLTVAKPATSRSHSTKNTIQQITMKEI